MATYKIKRKTFSDDDKSGMGLGTKLALGTAAVGGALLGAKHGMFGAGAQKAVGTGMMNIGMTKSGAETFAKGQMKTINKAREAKKLTALTGDAAKAQEQKIADNLIKKRETQSLLNKNAEAINNATSDTMKNLGSQAKQATRDAQKNIINSSTTAK